MIASGLAFPEGPVWADGTLLFTEITGGAVSRWTPGGGVEPYATTGGGPNGAALAADGSLYVTQNGGMRDGPRGTPGIQRIAPDGDVTTVVTEVAGMRLEGPNDLAVGDDGRLWFTDPRGSDDPAVNDRPGRIFAVDPANGDGDLIIEVGPVFPNGIAFLADGTLVWTESFSRRVMAMVDGAARARRRVAGAPLPRRPLRRCRRPAVRRYDVRPLRHRRRRRRHRRPVHVRGRDGDELLLR